MATKKSNAVKMAQPKISVDKDSSVGIRQIENGFVVSESGYTGKGRSQKYYNKEYFSKTNPLKGVMSGGSASGNTSGMKFGGKK